jgi:hypothetical protein
VWRGSRDVDGTAAGGAERCADEERARRRGAVRGRGRRAGSAGGVGGRGRRPPPPAPAPFRVKDGFAYGRVSRRPRLPVVSAGASEPIHRRRASMVCTKTVPIHVSTSGRGRIGPGMALRQDWQSYSANRPARLPDARPTARPARLPPASRTPDPPDPPGAAWLVATISERTVALVSPYSVSEPSRPATAEGRDATGPRGASAKGRS